MVSSDWEHALSVVLLSSAAFGLGMTASHMLSGKLTVREPTTVLKGTESKLATVQSPSVNELHDTDVNTLIIRAVNFSAHKHRNQRRKNPSQIPYINHPISVAHRLMNTASISDPITLAAAILHDTLEDTDTTIDELLNEFGRSVTSVVEECSDDKNLSKLQRKQLQIDHARHASYRAKLVKLADKLDNLSDLLVTTPIGWKPERVNEYFDWSEKVVNGMRGTNAALETSLDEVFAKRQVAIDAAAVDANSSDSK